MNLMQIYKNYIHIDFIPYFFRGGVNFFSMKLT